MAKIKKEVTMADIAEKLDVSVVTVSKALSGQKGVSDQVREKIVALAQEMNYQLPGAASKNRVVYRIGVLIPDSAQGTYDSFYWRMYQAVSDGAMQKGCLTSYEGLTQRMISGEILPRLLAERMADGLIVIGDPGKRYVEFLRKSAEIPLAFLDFYTDDMQTDCFVSNGFYGTYFLTRYLLSKGHEKIAYVGTLQATQSITDRYLGYQKALMEQGRNPRPEDVIPDRSAQDGTSGNFEEFSLPKELPTAFVCNCDFTAALLIRNLRQRGLRVPQDVSVVGFDDYLGSFYQEIGITTYAADIPAMAGAAVETLITRMNGGTVRAGIHITEGYFVEKESVAPPRSK